MKNLRRKFQKSVFGILNASSWIGRYVWRRKRLDSYDFSVIDTERKSRSPISVKTLQTATYNQYIFCLHIL